MTILHLRIGDIDERAFRYYQIAEEYLRAVVNVLEIDVPGLYGADNQRSEIHERIITETGISREKMQDISNNLDKVCYLELTPGYYNGAFGTYSLAESAVLLANEIHKAVSV